MGVFFSDLSNFMTRRYVHYLTFQLYIPPSCSTLYSFARLIQVEIECCMYRILFFCLILFHSIHRRYVHFFDFSFNFIRPPCSTICFFARLI